MIAVPAVLEKGSSQTRWTIGISVFLITATIAVHYQDADMS